MSATDAAQSVNDSHRAHNRQCTHRRLQIRESQPPSNHLLTLAGGHLPFKQIRRGPVGSGLASRSTQTAHLKQSDPKVGAPCPS
jgi:hypothetical protein